MLRATTWWLESPIASFGTKYLAQAAKGKGLGHVRWPRHAAARYGSSALWATNGCHTSRARLAASADDEICPHQWKDVPLILPPSQTTFGAALVLAIAGGVDPHGWRADAQFAFKCPHRRNVFLS